MLQDSSTFIICELSQTHEGSIALAKMLIKAAATAKADAVKMHVFAADELAVPNYKHYELLKKLEWSEDQWRSIVDYSHEQGICFYADILGVESLKMMTKIGVDGIKIHGTDMRNTRLLKSLADVELPILLAVGGGTIEEINYAVETLRSGGRKSPVVLMHGIQSYPTLVEHANLNKMRYFMDKCGMPVGYADHIDGDHPLDVGLCAVAIGMGATVIEKHITISRALEMEDYESALSPDSFVSFVSKIRDLNKAMGDYSDNLHPFEQKYRKETRKHVVAAVSLKEGQIIEEHDIALRRVDTDYLPSDLDDVVGNKAERDYEVNDVILSGKLI